MKELRISLDEATVKALEAEVAAGEAASIEELIEAALGAWLDPAAPTSRANAWPISPRWIAIWRREAGSIRPMR